MHFLIPLLIAAPFFLNSIGCCKAKPAKTIVVTKTARNCLENLTPPQATTIERVRCEGSSAVACFDFENTKRLLGELDRLRQYVAEAESLCRENPERNEP